jgi:hypothetical protein
MKLTLLLAIACGAGAQTIAVGVTGGVPISEHSQDFGQGCLASTCGPNRLTAKPYAIGPTLEIQIPWRLSVQAGMLYERLHLDVSHGLQVGRGSNNVNFGEYYGASANAWLFPLQLKYVFGGRKLAPFINAGATLRHLGPFDGDGIRLDFFLQPQRTKFHIESGRDLDVAETVGGGVRWRAGVFDISPEIRFLHWTSTYYQPAQNLAMLMLGITLPVRR